MFPTKQDVIVSHLNLFSCTVIFSVCSDEAAAAQWAGLILHRLGLIDSLPSVHSKFKTFWQDSSSHHLLESTRSLLPSLISADWSGHCAISLTFQFNSSWYKHKIQRRIYPPEQNIYRSVSSHEGFVVGSQFCLVVPPLVSVSSPSHQHFVFLLVCFWSLGF